MNAPADSRLSDLTGRPGGPALELPSGLLDGLAQMAEDLARDSGAVGRPVVVDPVGLVCARAAVSGLTRKGDASCGGACRLLACRDGWVAVSLPRPDDWAMTAAWLALREAVGHGHWEAIGRPVAERTASDLTAGAALLGLAVATVGERPGAGGAAAVGRPGVTVHDCGPGDPVPGGRPLTVVDLSAMWAGPLAASLLRRSGAQVVKVESTNRPDGARMGPPAFFHSLNAGKVPVSFDFASAAGRRALSDLVSRADVVVTSVRLRALVQLGLDPQAMVRAGGPGVWLAVTGYGDAAGSADRVAFGDDAAAAGGLVAWDDDGPCFCGDALADPATGMAGAAGVLAALRSGRRSVVVASMADVAGGLT